MQTLCTIAGNQYKIEYQKAANKDGLWFQGTVFRNPAPLVFSFTDNGDNRGIALGTFDPHTDLNM